MQDSRNRKLGQIFFRSDKSRFIKLRSGLLTVIIIAFFSHTGMSEEHRESVITDSLMTLLKSTSADTAKIDIYFALYASFLANDTTKAYYYSNEALSLSKKINDTRRMSKAYLNLAYLFRINRKFPEAEAVLSQMETEFKNLKGFAMDPLFYQERGTLFYLQGDYVGATRNFLKALNSYTNNNDSLGIAEANNKLGNVYWVSKKYDKALEYFQKALKIVKNTDNYRYISRFLGNIGLIYRAKGDYKKALDYYNQSLELNRKTGNKFDASIDLGNIAVLYLKMNDSETALKYYKESYKISTEIDDQIGVLYTKHGMGSIYVENGRYREALALFGEALKLARQLNNREEIKNIYESLADTYEKMGDYRKAYSNQRLFEKWKDSLIGEDYLKQIQELEIKYETAKKNQEISLLTKEKEIQQIRTEHQSTINKALTGGIILIFVIAGLLIYTQRQRARNQRILTRKNVEIRESNFKQQLMELEMKALRAQMNPHFLFNSLNSINRMILGGDTDAASRYLTLFSKLIRMVLENSEHNTVALNDELSLLENYVQLESLRFGGKIRYETSVEAGIDPDEVFIPSMVLQPLVENAIWHGLMHKEGGGTISVSVKKEGELLKCSVLDDGIGRNNAVLAEEKEPVKNRSFGLQITRDRLSLMNKENVDRFIDIEDLKDAENNAIGTRVDLLIPVS